MDPQTTKRPGPDQAMVNPFPQPGRRLEQAYRELTIAMEGTKEQKKALGNPWLLPRPWDPDTITNPTLRRELWDWLENVVAWFNVEYVWDVAAVIPACWPNHPHLVRELAVLADQRRRAARAFGSDALEEWHRYALPAFVERMRARIKNHCEDGHQQWPAKGRHARHTSPAARQERQRTFTQDAATLRHAVEPPTPEGTTPRLYVVDGVHSTRSPVRSSTDRPGGTRRCPGGPAGKMQACRTHPAGCSRRFPSGAERTWPGKPSSGGR